MPPRIVCIHGRGQERERWKRLRRQWVAALNKGLTLADLPPVSADSVVFPFYGDVIKRAIDELATKDLAAGDVRNFAARSDGTPLGVAAADPELSEFQLTLLEALAEGVGVDLEEARGDARRRELLDEIGKFEAIQDVLEWINDEAPWAGERLIYQVTRDVSLYLRKRPVREAVLAAVLERLDEELAPDDPVIFVTHSLGTVVGMDVVTDWGARREIPLLITCGSPLGIKEIYSNLKVQPQPKYPKAAGRWVNAYDRKDVVALVEKLGPVFPGGNVVDLKVRNGDEPHAMERYLAHRPVAAEVGRALQVRP